MKIPSINLRWLDRFTLAFYFACLMGVFATSLIYARGLQDEMLVEIAELRVIAQEHDDTVMVNSRMIKHAEADTVTALKLIRENAEVMVDLLGTNKAISGIVFSNADLAHKIELHILDILERLDVEPDGWRGQITKVAEEIKRCACETPGAP